MCVFKQMCWDFNCVVVTLIMMLHTCLSSGTTVEPFREICGTVQTSTGKTVRLREGVPLTPEEFSDVRNITLKNSVFSPASGCAVQVCGFMSWGTLKEEGYIGTTSDYTDCIQFTVEKNGDDIFYEPFYTSSIECGCKTPTSICSSTCTDFRTKSWTTSDCAILYQERDCNECYLPHIRLSENQNYTTDNTRHAMSVAVRPGCRVLQYSPGMRKWYWFKDMEQPVVYEKNDEAIFSSFLGESEDFVCRCGGVEPDPVLMPPPGESSGGGGWGVIVGVGVSVMVVVVCVGGFVVRRKSVGGKLSGVWRGLRDRGIERVVLEHDMSTTVSTRQSSMDQVGTPPYATDHKLEEKLDDVKRLLELLCGCSNVRQVPLMNEQAFASVTEQFSLVCDPEKVIPREAILYTEGSTLGRGQFGTVYKGLVTHNDGLRENVAVKVVKWENCTEDHVKSFIREVKTFSEVGCGCEYIVKFVGGCVCGDGVFVVTQFCEGGSLEEYVRGLHISEGVRVVGDGYTATDARGREVVDVGPVLVKFCYQVACGMEWLSGKGVVHGDLAVRNVLVSGGGDVRICDFGLSRVCCGGEYVVGSLNKFPYNSLAPEVCKCDRDTYKLSSNVDVWAYGCTVFEIFGGSMYAHVQAEGSDKVVEVMRLLVRGFRHQRPVGMGGDVYDKVMECWDEDPGRRPSFKELKEFFGGMGL